MRARITAVEVIPLHVPFKTPVKIAAGAARPFLEALIVRVKSDQGVEGIGETQAWRRQGSSETLKGLMAVIVDHCTPQVIGKSPFEVAAIAHVLDQTIYHSYYAKAALLDALLDLQGKLLGVPVYQLLGGLCRDEVAACAVLTMKPELEETLANAQRWFERGFTSFTVKVGNDRIADFATVKGIRDRFGEEVRIRIDANACMDFDNATALLDQIRPFGIEFAEQLLPPWDVEGMAELSRRYSIPMMADESLATVHDLLTIIRARAARVVQTKAAKNGGIWHSRKIWDIADAAGLKVYPGNHPSTSIATLSVAHLAAAWPGPLLDGPFATGISGVLAEDVVTEPVKMRGNRLPLPKAPGLGITIDEQRIRLLRVDL